MRLPRDGGRLAGRPRLDDDGVGALEHEALASFDDVVVEIALAGQPDPAAQDGELTGQALDAHGGRKLEGSSSGLRENLRSHHQSPGWFAIIVLLYRPCMIGISEGYYQ